MEKSEGQGNMYNLKELLTEYVFIIPDYQRDYAQGRQNPRDEHVLNMFVDEISNALSSGKSLHLDYVYGDIEERNGAEFFFPVDGQQRLTTLFLFYIYCYQAVKDEQEKAFLSRLRYDIRITSNKLINSLIKDGFKEPESTSLDWTQWINLHCEISTDPTAVALLRAYRKIEKKLEPGKREEYKEKLEKITFEVVETKKHNLPKTVFWKMNARGRALTQSEVFKAAFFLKGESAKNFDDFAEKLFCLVHGSGNDYQVFEKTLMNIVNVIFEGFKEIRYKADSHDGFDFWGATYTSKDEYLNYQSERKDEINQIFSALQKSNNPFEVFDLSLPEYVKRQSNGGILNCLVKNSGLTQNIRALFFSYLIALPIETEFLKEWIRVCSNLIWNSSNVASALKLIFNELLPHASDILSFLSIERNRNLSNMPQYQEEYEKAKAIEDKKISITAIEEAESTHFADGRIDFLFFDGNWNVFTNRLNSFKTWFDEKKGVRDDYKEAIVTAYIKLSPWDWDELYFNTSREHWKNRIFGGIHDKSYGAGYIKIVDGLLSATDLCCINLTEGESQRSDIIRKSLIDNPWFVKWMMNNHPTFKIMWYGHLHNETPIFTSENSGQKIYIYWDVGGWVYKDIAGTQNKQITEFFFFLNGIVQLDGEYFRVIDDEGNEITDFENINFDENKNHLIVWGYYKKFCYVRFTYKKEKVLYLTTPGIIVTEEEYNKNKIYDILSNEKLYETRCIYQKQQDNWFAGNLSDKEKLKQILDGIVEGN